ncbi:6-phosphogluconolactonase [Stappia stellulata]|uniref:6-phosphogluconolactonase n=1 Tax=Stappia stellulata TaxID=71235 RepID=UPI00040D654C|nr:6-phosphogluconolactonase [Stappia stellulata]
MKIAIHDTPEAIGEHLATRILAEIGEANADGRPYVLGCPGGRSPMPVYQALERRLKATPVDCSRLVIAMMDEYLLGDADGLHVPPACAHYSCRGFGEREIVGRINGPLPDALRMQEANFRMPSLAEPEAFDRDLAKLGGVDLFLLASGAGDGHIAFNPPGSDRNSRTRIVALAEQTRHDNLATFPDFTGIESVPAHGLTIGTGSIATLSKAVAMIVWGDGKRAAFGRLSNATAYDPSWPATILAECANGELHADIAAGRRP